MTPRALLGVIPECRDRNKPWTLPSVGKQPQPSPISVTQTFPGHVAAEPACSHFPDGCLGQGSCCAGWERYEMPGICRSRYGRLP